MTTDHRQEVRAGLTPAAHREKMMGCWLGKAVGGTLGQTFEGLTGPLSASYYVPVPTGMVPNDDLDLQVLFACILAGQDDPRVDRYVLADSWADHVAFPWNEYGVGQRNQAEGLLPPFTGAYDNWFTCGEGAAIRSELWACLAPGNPDLAAAFAYEDACFDHAGDGIVAAQFLARLQSAAFVDDDPDRLLDVALAGIPSDSGIHAAVTDTRRWVAAGLTWTEVRRRIMNRYGCSDFTDVRPNTAFVVLGWLAGTDFGDSICITNNCGEDCDSSTASLGALLGILDPDAIDARWLAPIGTDLVLNPEITGIDPPATLDGFTDLVLDLSERLGGRRPSPAASTFDPSSRAIPIRRAWANTMHGKWDVRDQTELPPVGAALPTDLDWHEATLPGTWVRMARDEFEDRLCYLHYRIHPHGRPRVRLMVNSTEHYRLWIDGVFVHGAQGSQYQFPAPHMPPVGQYVDLELSSEAHDLVLCLKKPPTTHAFAEWVVALAELPGFMWVPDGILRVIQHNQPARKDQ